MGKAIPRQAAGRMADIGAPMASMGCRCRRQHRAYEERSPEEFSCLGTGVGMFKWERWPERYKGGVHFMPAEEVKEDILCLEAVKRHDESGSIKVFLDTLKAGLRNDPTVDWITRCGGPAYSVSDSGNSTPQSGDEESSGLSK